MISVKSNAQQHCSFLFNNAQIAPQISEYLEFENAVREMPGGLAKAQALIELRGRRTELEKTFGIESLKLTRDLIERQSRPSPVVRKVPVEVMIDVRKYQESWGLDIDRGIVSLQALDIDSHHTDYSFLRYTPKSGSLQWSADDSVLAISYSSGQTRIFKMERRKRLTELKPPGLLSQDGERYAYHQSSHVNGKNVNVIRVDRIIGDDSVFISGDVSFGPPRLFAFPTIATVEVNQVGQGVLTLNEFKGNSVKKLPLPNWTRLLGNGVQITRTESYLHLKNKDGKVIELNHINKLIEQPKSRYILATETDPRVGTQLHTHLIDLESFEIIARLPASEYFISPNGKWIYYHLVKAGTYTYMFFSPELKINISEHSLAPIQFLGESNVILRKTSATTYETGDIRGHRESAARTFEMEMMGVSPTGKYLLGIPLGGSAEHLHVWELAP